ncbi:MAG TPA: PD-(D/E)XK nuclease family protein, partial [Pseudolysinimonas sp.]|nr:PD-(D/E)XK nuclease family protein [Pseudolysinimonas sp.]
EKPYRATRLGTLFHAWVENRSLAAVGDSLVDPSDLDAAPGELDGDLDDNLIGADAETLAALQARFEASPWANRQPVDVEREIHLPFDSRIIICKIDAVYRDETDGDRFEIVDWKTGRAPADEADIEKKQLQLALYRLAYATWAGVKADRIDAAFYFVADDLVIRPAHIDSEADLLRRWRAVFPPASLA